MTNPQDTYTPWDFDKLNDIKTEGSTFQMTCDYCDSTQIELRPTNTPWRTKEENTDLGSQLNKMYNKLPTLPKAILQALQQQKEILTICNDCNNASNISLYIDRTKLTNWMKKKYGEIDDKPESELIDEN